MKKDMLEDYASTLGIMTAGIVSKNPGVIPPTAEQVHIWFYAAISSLAMHQPDFDPNEDITDLLELAVFCYSDTLIYILSQALYKQKNDDLEAEVVEHLTGLFHTYGVDEDTLHELVETHRSEEEEIDEKTSEEALVNT